jgi:hypothetical protein
MKGKSQFDSGGYMMEHLKTNNCEKEEQTGFTFAKNKLNSGNASYA